MLVAVAPSYRCCLYEYGIFQASYHILSPMFFLGCRFPRSFPVLIARKHWMCQLRRYPDDKGVILGGNLKTKYTFYSRQKMLHLLTLEIMITYLIYATSKALNKMFYSKDIQSRCPYVYVPFSMFYAKVK